jgi:hypothetical protein
VAAQAAGRTLAPSEVAVADRAVMVGGWVRQVGSGAGGQGGGRRGEGGEGAADGMGSRVKTSVCRDVRRPVYDAGSSSIKPINYRPCYLPPALQS